MGHWGKCEAGKNIPLRWCTPPRVDKYSIEVVYPDPVEKYSTEVVYPPPPCGQIFQ